eukprot:3780390-Pyramimonas_sp.AAC.1
MADVRDQALLNMVKYIQDNGNAGLRQMASQSQLSDTEFLYRLVGCARADAPLGHDSAGVGAVYVPRRVFDWWDHVHTGYNGYDHHTNTLTDLGTASCPL